MIVVMRITSSKWKFAKANVVMTIGEKNSNLYWTKALVAKESVNAMYTKTICDAIDHKSE